MKWRWWSRWAAEWQEEAHEHIGDGVNPRLVAIALGAIVATLLALGIYWSREPAPFDVTASFNRTLREPTAHPVAGAVTTATLVQIVTTLLDKPGGFINNDIAPPGVWLDNMPSWERGALQQARDMTRALRDDFGRAGANAEPDEDLAHAQPRLNFSESSWMLPSSESQYRDARDYLRAYLLNLQKGVRLQKSGEPTAVFAATPANLDRYLAQVALRLDALAQRLSACVTPRENLLLQSGARELGVRATTPAYQIDNVFYEARGSAWALLHLLRAIEIDFAVVLREKNAQNALHAVIRDLDATQDTIYSPVILNGSGFGLLANHSLVMASYIARANTAAANVRRLLTEIAPAPDATTERSTNASATTEQEAK